MKPNKNISILLVDDNEIDLFLHEKLLRLSGISQDIKRVISAKDGLVYLSELQVYPDLILLDIQMPEMDGFEFLRQLEDFPEEVKNRLTIIMVSSSLDFGDINKAKANSLVTDFLKKPLSIKDLRELLIREKLLDA